MPDAGRRDFAGMGIEKGGRPLWGNPAQNAAIPRFTGNAFPRRAVLLALDQRGELLLGIAVLKKGRVTEIGPCRFGAR